MNFNDYMERRLSGMGSLFPLLNFPQQVRNTAAEREEKGTEFGRQEVVANVHVREGHEESLNGQVFL